MENNMDCRNDKSRLKSSAHHILSTLKPPIKLSANKIMTAFTINKNRPKVMIVMGSVRITKMGFTIKFKRLSTIATITAVVYESTPTPGNTLDRITTATALRSVFNIKFIIFLV